VHLPIPLRIKLVLFLLLSSLMVACTGSPVWVKNQTNEELYEYVLKIHEGKTMEEICNTQEKLEEVQNEHLYSSSSSSRLRYKQASRVLVMISRVITDRGYDPQYCEDPEKFEYISNRNIKFYNIDNLKIMTDSAKESDCYSGNKHNIKIHGYISKDSSFAVEKILEELQPCRDQSGRIVRPILVTMNSSGGELIHGYKLGYILRKHRAFTYIGHDNVCASSCAVAFLGGERRIIEKGGVILFHSPYTILQTGERKKISCDVDDKTLLDLLGYYKTITDAEIGLRLFDRTLQYCSTEDGWVVKGGDAAYLFGITTDVLE